MYDEVTAFGAAMDAADRLLAEARNAARGQHSLGFAECPGCVLEEPAYAALGRDRPAAWDALEASSDPLVRWIARYYRDYLHEARMVLEALPASMAELDQIASDRGWCGDWARARRSAETAGVLPGQVMAEASER